MDKVRMDEIRARWILPTDNPREFNCDKDVADLLQALSERDAKIRSMREALKMWDDNFHRDLASGNFVGDDGHEAHRITELALPDDGEGE